MSLDYDHLMRLCLKYWKWLVAAVVIGFVGGYLYAASQTAIYEAFATIQVKPKDADVPNAGDTGVTGESPDALKTFEQLLETKDLAQRVVKAEHLNENQEFLAGYATAPVSEDAATTLLETFSDIRIRPMTRLIDITVDHPSPKMAKFLADQMADESIMQQFDQRTGNAGVLSDYMKKEVDRTSAEGRRVRAGA